MRVNVNDIASKCLVCPYCMSQVNESRLECCGESNSHFEQAYEMLNGDILLESEVKLDVTNGMI